MGNNRKSDYRLPSPWEVLLVLLGGYFITYFITMSIAGLINPEFVKKPELLMKESWFFVLTQLILLGFPLFYFHKKKYELGKIFLINPVSPKTVERSLILGMAIIPLLDELDRIIQGLLALNELGEEFFTVFQQDSIIGFAGIALTVVVLTPLFEEMIFRGALLQSFSKKLGIINSIIFTSLFWAFMHAVMSWTIQIFILGLLLGVLTYIYNSIIPALIIHMVYNLFSLLYLNIESKEIFSYYEQGEHVLWYWLLFGLVITFAVGKKIFAEPDYNS